MLGSFKKREFGEISAISHEKSAPGNFNAEPQKMHDDFGVY
jgi:hypothetical protein